jgi:hypothetical protein
LGVLFLGAFARGAEAPAPTRLDRGWGIDAADALAGADPAVRTAYLLQLRDADIGIVRVRGPIPAMAELRAAGFRVVSFLDLGSLPIEQRGDVTPEDLLGVYTAAKAMQHRRGGYVDAWEMVGEPDVGYCRDLPDRVVAFQKAVYLGIKAGAAESRAAREPMVLMGALALPPGPWLERAARNGLLDYTDAYNFHFYGFAEDLSGVIRAHRAFAERWATRPEGQRPPLLPLWITECGIDAIDPGDFLNPERRRLQAEFTIATAQQAYAAPAVTVFMPFVLACENAPHALMLAPDRPLPAWSAYSDYARRHPFPSRLLVNPPTEPNKIVVQWMPDLRTAIPQKVSGSYRFWEQEPMRGTMRIYNFGQHPVHGRLEAGDLPHVALSSPILSVVTPKDNTGAPAFWSSSEFTIAAMGRVDVPVTLTPLTPVYFRDFWECRFRDDRGNCAGAYFGLEALPHEDEFTAKPLALLPLGQGKIRHPELDGETVTSRSDAWVGLNGLHVEEHEGGLRVFVDALHRDPLQPTIAVARIDGLPSHGFLRLQLDRPMDSVFQVRLDLVDRKGQRFAIWENLGASYFGPRDDLWLNLEDFGIYFWGRCTESPRLRPEQVEEIRLRCYFNRANEPRVIRWSFVQPVAGSRS